MFYLLVLTGIIVGALLPWQPVINSRLSFEIGSTLWASFISFLGGAFVLGLIVLFQGQLSERIQKLITLPAWMMSGGVLGITFVLASIILVPRIGATSLTATFVCGQLAMSLAMDHFGLAGLNTRPIDATRLLGVILLFVGLLLIVRPQHAT